MTGVAASGPTASPATRLLRLIALAEGRPAPASGGSLPCFGERLSRLFDLGDTMTLDSALALRRQRPVALQPPDDALERLCGELARTRDTLRQQAQCYGESLAGEHGADTEISFVPFLEAYLAQQRKHTAASRQLRAKVRKTMAEQVPPLARLVELDKVFDQTLAGFTSQAFANITKVLEQRFLTLRTAQQSDGLPPSNGSHWLQHYCGEAQTLLIAELDVRLEPVVGLLEAYKKEVHPES